MFAKSVFFLVPLVSLFQKINLTLMIMLFNQGSLVSIKVLLSAINFFNFYYYFSFRALSFSYRKNCSHAVVCIEVVFTGLHKVTNSEEHQYRVVLSTCLVIIGLHSMTWCWHIFMFSYHNLLFSYLPILGYGEVVIVELFYIVSLLYHYLCRIKASTSSYPCAPVDGRITNQKRKSKRNNSSNR